MRPDTIRLSMSRSLLLTAWLAFAFGLWMIAPRSEGDVERVAQTVIVGAVMGLFEPDKYRTKDKEKREIKSVTVVIEDADKKAVQRGAVSAIDGGPEQRPIHGVVAGRQSCAQERVELGEPD